MEYPGYTSGDREQVLFIGDHDDPIGDKLEADSYAEQESEDAPAPLELLGAEEY